MRQIRISIEARVIRETSKISILALVGEVSSCLVEYSRSTSEGKVSRRIPIGARGHGEHLVESRIGGQVKEK